jgi:hypothetical protein
MNTSLSAGIKHLTWQKILAKVLFMYLTSKRIELESPNCSGFEANLKNFKI